MAWDGKVTNVGLSLLEQWGTGSQTLHIDKATIGTGTVPSASLIASTTVAGEIGETPITGSSVVTGGIQYQVQVQTQTAAYTLHQIGVWGHLGDSGTATLIAVFQEEDGINIPAEADEPGYALTVYCTVAMSNTGSITINLSGGAYATLDMMNAALAEKQNTLTFDTAPTSGSTNPVTSGGVYAKIGAVGNTPLQTQINNNLQIIQHIIPSSTGDTLTSVSALNSALSNNSYNRIAISASARASLADAGMIPVASAGLWEVIKGTSGYMFMEYSTYSGAKYIANINNGVLSKWIETTNLNIEDGIAIVAVGNTHSAITAGQFVYVRNHDTLSAGIYTAKSNIAANATLSTSNLTAVSGGGLNALNSIINTKPTRTVNSWGSTISWTANGATSLLMISNVILVLVWTPSSTDISVFVASERGNHRKTNETAGVILFGKESTDTTYQITRSGNDLTLTLPKNESVKIIT